VLGDHLQRPRLSRAGRPGDEAVAIRHGERHAHVRIVDDGAVQHTLAELDGRARRRVGLGDRLAEIGRSSHQRVNLHGRT
jgi:hypothetical protein